MKVEFKDRPKIIPVTEMKIGETGVLTGSTGGWSGTVVLRTYSGLVSLNNPKATWNPPFSSDSEVELRTFKLVEG